MYTIKQVAQATGTPPATLRAWERRYGVGAPARTESGYRLYDDTAVAVLRRMGELVAAGWPPSRAAREVGGPTAGDVELSPYGGAPADDRAIDALVAAAARLDADAVRRLVDEAFAAADFESVADDWLMPALVRIGREWAQGAAGIAAEHLLSNVIRAKLSVLLDSAERLRPRAAAAGRPPTVVLGLLGGSHHELGLLAFAVAAGRQGLDVCYLGADLPADSWRQAATRTGAAALVTVAVTGDDVARITTELAGLELPDEVVLAVGGALQEDFAPPILPLGHRIGTAAARLRGLVTS